MGNIKYPLVLAYISKLSQKYVIDEQNKKVTRVETLKLKNRSTLYYLQISLCSKFKLHSKGIIREKSVCV